MAEKMRAAVYCRLARADDERIAEQENRVSSYAKKQGCGEIAVFVDNDESGSSLNRPAMNRLNADIEAGLIDAVYVHSLPRIGRNVCEVLKWLDGLRDKGITVKAVDGSIGGDMDVSLFDAYLKSLRQVKKGGKQSGS
jgi:site-specific DNA recombinase